MSRSTIQPALVTKVLPGSIAEEIGFQAGDRLVSINDISPRDLIDYQFLCADEILSLKVLDSDNELHDVEIEKDYDADLGLEFSSALFDNLIQCNNRCPFCFIDQKPPGMRDTLYLKDDDYRLSFLYGSYLTLTNLSPAEWQRIEQLRLSPLYVSVHATEPEVRSRLLKNPRAGQILEQLQWFQERRLQIHAQVVVCPGINDGVHLERTLQDLAKFGKNLDDDDIPAVASVAVVPVGLTRFRPPEDELIPVSPSNAEDVIQQVHALQPQFREQLGSTFAWLADEWFLLAGREMPERVDYEGYPQIDNGVGSIRLFLDEFRDIAQQQLPSKVESPRHLTWVVGNAVRTAFGEILQQLNAVEGLTVEMVSLNSEFWGQEISVTGVLTGSDVRRGLQKRRHHLGDGIILPTVMLKHGETRFLDDVTVEELEQEFGIPILLANGTEGLIQACLTVNLLPEPDSSQRAENATLAEVRLANR